jgi:hypothetical protein
LYSPFARWLGPAAVLAAALAAAACGGGDEGPAAPGGQNGILLTYVTPRLRVVPSDSPGTVELALEVRRTNASSTTELWAGAPLRVVRETGLGVPSSTRIVTDELGIARVEVAMPAVTDKTAIVVSLEADSDSYLPFDVVSAPVVTLDLAAGEIRHLDPPRDGVLLRFASPDSGAQWALIPHITDVERGGVPYRFFHQPATSGAGAALFGAETIIEPGRAPPPGPIGRADIYAEMDPGPLVPSSTVASDINIRSCAIGTDRMAPLRYLGTHVAIYVDGDPDLHQARIDSLGAAFDERIMATNTHYFGATTDLDSNGVVLAVLTPELAGGAYCDSVRLRHIEVFYATWNPVIRIEAIMGLMAHEHQHVIHSGLRRFRTDDALWLNEGMSLAAEALNGFWYPAMPRAWRFLNGQNTGLSMFSLDYDRMFDDELMMLLLYLGDRYGDQFYRQLGTNDRFSRANVEDLTELTFDEVLRDWFVASGIADRGAVDDPRYVYRTIRLHGMDEEVAECACVPVPRLDGMRLETLRLGSGFDAFRTLASADADYYELLASPELPSGSRDVYYDAYGLLSVKLSIARIR